MSIVMSKSTLPGVGSPLRLARADSERFCAAFLDNKVKHLYDILFGNGELPDQQGDEQTPDTEESK